MVQLELSTVAQAETARSPLVALLQNVVDDGASIGFIAPLDAEEARAYWVGILPAMVEGNKLLFVARLDHQIVGSVQLALEPRRNGRHRAEVQKLMVHTAYRGHELGRKLMEALEEAARGNHRSLLVLDTRGGDGAEQLYQKLGYQLADTIPGYALSSDGKLHDTVFYYRQI